MKVQAASLLGLELGIAHPQPPLRPPPGFAAIPALPTTCDDFGSSNPARRILNVTKLKALPWPKTLDASSKQKLSAPVGPCLAISALKSSTAFTPASPSNVAF